MALGVPKVSVEALLESTVTEIAYDGQEKYVQPLSLSENLARLAQLIDFSKDEEDEKGKSTSEAELQLQLTDQQAEQQQRAKLHQQLAAAGAWPWESVRGKLLQSLTEMQVLLDVLSIAKEKRLLVLDPVSNEPHETKANFLLTSRKLALASAAEILARGAERLCKGQLDIAAKSQQQTEFHMELLKLRQNWRLKKVGNAIIGDLSYKTAGSTFWHAGSFEVIKKPATEPGSSSLEIVLPPDLEGAASIQVSIHMITDDDAVEKIDAMLGIPQEVPASMGDLGGSAWHRKLETAQNVLFCKEIMAQLSKEAYQLNASIPHMVVSNQIIVHLFPNFKMHITLCHKDKPADKDVLVQASGTTLLPAMAARQAAIAERVLQQALQQLMRAQHYRTLHRPGPHPASGSLGPSRLRRLAGPHGYSTQAVLELAAENCSLLEKMVAIARHTVLRLRTAETLDHMAKAIMDPLISVHADGLNDALNSSLSVTITAPGYDQSRRSFVLHIKQDKICAACDSGHEVMLSFESQELEDYVAWQVVQYQVQVVHILAKHMDWSVLSYVPSSGGGGGSVCGGGVLVTGLCSSLLISTPTGDKAIAVKGNPITGIQVLLQRAAVAAGNFSDRIQTDEDDLMTDPCWETLRGEFETVNVSALTGRNFPSKMEMMMAVLMK